MICPPHLRSAALFTGLAAGIAIPGFTNAAEPDQGRPSSAGESPQGRTGAQTLHEGTQPGAPGNLVTAATGAAPTTAAEAKGEKNSKPTR